MNLSNSGFQGLKVLKSHVWGFLGNRGLWLIVIGGSPLDVENSVNAIGSIPLTWKIEKMDEKYYFYKNVESFHLLPNWLLHESHWTLSWYLCQLQVFCHPKFFSWLDLHFWQQVLLLHHHTHQIPMADQIQSTTTEIYYKILQTRFGLICTSSKVLIGAFLMGVIRNDLRIPQ